MNPPGVFGIGTWHDRSVCEECGAGDDVEAAFYDIEKPMGGGEIIKITCKNIFHEYNRFDRT